MNMSSKQRIEAFTKKFYEAYLTKRDISLILDLLDEDICWSGSYTSTLLTTHAEVEGMLKRMQEAYPVCLYIIDLYQVVKKLQDGWYLINTHLQLSFHPSGEHPTFPLYGSLIVHASQEDLRLQQVHFSLMGTEQQIIEAIIDSFKNVDGKNYEHRQLEQAVKVKALHDDLQMLTDNVPGGIFRCRYDENLTIEYISEGFLDMLGYTRQMIAEKFSNSFLEMIYEKDRERTLREAMLQMKESKCKQLEYRMKTADGRILWVLDRGQLIEKPDADVPSFYCIVIDITEEKRIREELNLTLERYHIILEQTNDVIFEWDIPKDHLTISSNWEKVFAYPIPEKPASYLLQEEQGELIAPQDHYKLREVMDKVLHKVPYLEEEVRLLGQDHEYVWCRLRITTQLDQNGEVLKAIGIIVNINEEKKAAQHLRQKAEQDALTGMYNKITAQTRIRDYLARRIHEQCSALMIIDIDNFKQVNDTQGHLFGDAILGEFASIIKKTFRRSDIVGRIGGDEFIVFMKDICDQEVILRHARQIITQMHQMESVSSGMHISCSIGIALCPKDGTVFKDLYQKADHALYQAKKEGKNTYSFYDEHSMNAFYNNSAMEIRSVVNETIDSNSASNAAGSQLAEYVFRTLYKTRDVHTAISLILEIVGTQFDVSRVYIFENTQNDEYCCNTFEWCNSGVEPQIDSLQNVSYERDLGGNYMDNFNAEGIFYCPDIASLPPKQYDILAPQGIKSMLQCAITDNGKFSGYVGFDECRQNRYWNQSQIDALVFISEILSTFLLKSHAEDSLRRESDGLLSALDNQNSLIYVMDPSSYELLFVNKKTTSCCPDARSGLSCHKVLRNLDHPCRDCPAHAITHGCRSITDTVYNDYLDLWFDAEASYIRWKGRDAVLLCCHDISAYKK